jgi:hypothetical protein
MLNVFLANGMFNLNEDELFSKDESSLEMPLNSQSSTIDKRNVFSFMWMNKDVKNKFIENLLKEYQYNLKLTHMNKEMQKKHFAKKIKLV